ncbi:MAG: hypothetical protein ACTSVB_07960 [Candidatus Heimdallarchaeaceae archaeon]
MSFKKWLKDNSALMERTIILYNRTVNRFLREYGEVSLETLNKFVTNSFRNKRSCYVKYAFRYYLKFIGKEELYKQIVPVKVSPVKKEGVYLPAEKLFKIVNGIQEETFRMVALLQCITGGRSHDILSIEKAQIKEKKDGSLQITLITKGNKKRYVFIPKHYTNTITQFVEKYDRKYPFLKNWNKDESLRKAVDRNYRYYYNYVKESAKKLGYKNFATHDFRRNFIDDVQDITRDIRQTAVASGITVDTAIRYLNKKVGEEQLKEIIKKIR